MWVGQAEQVRRAGGDAHNGGGGQSHWPGSWESA